jgi:hypothetical protein
MSELHQRLLKMVQHLPSDFEPYGDRSRDDDWGLIALVVASISCRWRGNWVWIGAFVRTLLALE